MILVTGFFHLLGILLIVIEVIYIFYAFIIVRQVSLLNKSFMTEFSFVFTFLSYVHLLFSFVVFLTSLVFLV